MVSGTEKALDDMSDNAFVTAIFIDDVYWYY